MVRFFSSILLKTILLIIETKKVFFRVHFTLRTHSRFCIKDGLFIIFFLSQTQLHVSPPETMTFTVDTWIALQNGLTK